MAFSRQKARYITALAYNTISGEFDADALDNLPDEKVYTKIISQLGFGPWSAHIYLLFTLGRADILPRNDLAIDKALTFVFNLNRKPDYNEALKLMEPFNGQRSAASLLL
jgi:DNA-3-methyladenine glycosylase II